MRKNKSLSANALLNAIKQCCVILFPLIVFPYISRILGDENYGKYSFASSIMAYVSLVAGLGIKNYAIREGARIRNDKKELGDFVNEIFTINVLSTVFALLVLFVVLLTWRKTDDYRHLILILSSSVIFTTIGTDWINSIFEDYLYITIRYIICHLLATVAIFLFIRKTEDYVIYSIISISAEAMANIFNVYHIRHTLGIKVGISWNKELFNHTKPILLIFGTAIATKVYVNSDITILGVFCSDSIVGNYSVAAKIYSLLKQLVNALMIVAIPRISGMLASTDRKTVNKQLTRIHDASLILVIPIAAGLFMLRREVVLLISGAGYGYAVAPLGILSFSLVCASLACFYVNVVMLPSKMEKRIFWITLISAAVNIVLNFILIPLFGIVAAAVTTLLSEFIMVVYGLYSSRNYINYSARPYLCAIINGISVFVITYFVKKIFQESYIILILSILLSGVIFILALFILYRQEAIVFLKGKVKKLMRR